VVSPVLPFVRSARARLPRSRSAVSVKIEVADHSAHALALLKREPDSLGLEVVVNSPAAWGYLPSV
jgi:hypothetical protein